MTMWFRRRPPRDAYAWLRETHGEMHVVRFWDSRPSVALFETEGGAILHWIIDADPESDTRTSITLHLTDREVGRVLKNLHRTDVGLLEPIRRTLDNPHAVVGTYGEAGETVAPVLIDAKASEADFIEAAFDAVENPRLAFEDAARRFLTDESKVADQVTSAHDILVPRALFA